MQTAPKRTNMSNQLVTVATFSEVTEAYVVRGRLQEQDILCFVTDAHTVSANWFYSNAIGGVKLQVRQADAPRAQKIVEREHQQRREGAEQFDWTAINPKWTFDGTHKDEHAVTCPACGSMEVFQETFSKPLVFLSILLLGIPLPFFSRKWSCRTCGHTWKPKLFG